MVGREKFFKPGVTYGRRVCAAPWKSRTGGRSTYRETASTHPDSLEAVLKLLSGYWKLENIQVDNSMWKILADKEKATVDHKEAWKAGSDLPKRIPDIIATQAGRLGIGRAKMVVYVIHNPNRVKDDSQVSETFRFCLHVRTKQGMKAVFDEALVQTVMES